MQRKYYRKETVNLMYDHHRHGHDDGPTVMVMVPSTVHQTSGGGKHGEGKGKEQDSFHIKLLSFSVGLYAAVEIAPWGITLTAGFQIAECGRPRPQPCSA